MKRTILAIAILTVPVMATADPTTEYCRRRAAESFSFGQQVFNDCMARVSPKTRTKTRTASPSVLDPAQATDVVASLLKGPPYGSTKAEIASGIKSQILIIKGNDPCLNAPIRAATWAFRVEAIDQNSRDASGNPSLINGFLTIDAATGQKICASLPFLD